MKAKGIATLLLAALAAFIPSCQTHDAGIDPTMPGVTGEPQTTCYAFPSDEYLAGVWDWFQTAEFFPISGVIDPSVGGRIAGAVPGYPPGSEFEVVFPPRCFPGPPRSFTMYVMVHDQSPNDPITQTTLLRLEPDVTFVRPVQVSLWTPSWMIEVTRYNKFCIHHISDDPLVLGYTDHEYVGPVSDTERHRISFQTAHFSHWGLENGKGGGEQ